MSRQSKNASRKRFANRVSDLHKRGEKGPASTKPLHNKNPARRLWSKTSRGQPARGQM